MESLSLIRIFIAIIIALLLGYRGYKKKSLSKSGAIAAIIVGFIAFAFSYQFGTILIIFYLTSSRVTKIKEHIKAKLEYDYIIGGQRTYIQVFSCSILASLIILFHSIYYGGEIESNLCFNSKEILHIQNTSEISKILTLMYIAHYACANGDTWSSEIGILSPSKPRLVTTFFLREVPSGTNGGMSLFGTLASGIGGLVIGLTYYLFVFFPYDNNNTFTCNQYPVLYFGFIAGFLGSLIDSLLGATCQASYYSQERKMIVRNPGDVSEDLEHICGINLFSNEMVNFISIGLTMIVMIPLAPYIFF